MISADETSSATRGTRKPRLMSMDTNAGFAYEPEVVYPPGETLVEWLDEHDVTRDDFARRCGLPKPRLDQILDGTAPITEQIASALARTTGVSSAFWNRLESSYRSAELARRTANTDGP